MNIIALAKQKMIEGSMTLVNTTKKHLNMPIQGMTVSQLVIHCTALEDKRDAIKKLLYTRNRSWLSICMEYGSYILISVIGLFSVWFIQEDQPLFASMIICSVITTGGLLVNKVLQKNALQSLDINRSILIKIDEKQQETKIREQTLREYIISNKLVIVDAMKNINVIDPSFSAAIASEIYNSFVRITPAEEQVTYTAGKYFRREQYTMEAV